MESQSDDRAARKAREAEEKRVLDELLLRHSIELAMAYPHSECPAGWAPIVDDLLRGLAALGFRRVEQIKSKFGALRVYLPEGAPPEAQALVDRAAERSAKACERCGLPATGRTARGWASTRCDACADAARREWLLAASARVLAAHDETFRKLAQ